MTHAAPVERPRWLQVAIPRLRNKPVVDTDEVTAEVVQLRAVADYRAVQLRAALQEALVEVENRARIGLRGR